MNHEQYLTRKPPNTCPICATSYYPPKGRTSPTCGKPDCIREARERGLLFASQRTDAVVKPLAPRKRRTGKSKK